MAEDTWTREQQKWEHLKLLRVIPVLGSRQKRIRALNTPGDVYVASRDSVPWLVDYYQNAWPFDMVVIDELSSFKNHRSLRFRKLRLVRKAIRRIVGLTGTPAPNGLIDLWAQIFLLDEGVRLGRTLTEYRKNYFTPGARNRDVIFSYEPLPSAESAIQDRIRDICISLSAKDYLKLPERIDNVVHVRLSPGERKGYDDFERNMLLEVDEDTLDAGSAAVLSNKLLQYCNGAVYDEAKNVVEIHDGKLEALKEVIGASQGKPVLVFYSFQHDRNRILRSLSGGRLRVRTLDNAGTVSAWNEKEIDVLLAHPASAAYGLNMQAGGNIIVWFGLTYSLELYQQANARLHRQGQRETVIIHHLVAAGCRDEKVMEVLSDKAATQEDLLASLRARIKEVKGMVERGEKNGLRGGQREEKGIS